MALAAKAKIETYSAGRMLKLALKIAYPTAMITTCWWSLHGTGDNIKRFTFKPPQNHEKLNSSQYAALPAPMQQHREKIVKEQINLYNTTPSIDTQRVYDTDAIFEDPISILNGKTSIACIIYGLPKVVRKAEVCFISLSFCV